MIDFRWVYLNTRCKCSSHALIYNYWWGWHHHLSTLEYWCWRVECKISSVDRSWYQPISKVYNCFIKCIQNFFRHHYREKILKKNQFYIIQTTRTHRASYYDVIIPSEFVPPRQYLFTSETKAVNYDLCSELGIEQWGLFSVPHLLWNGASVYNGHLRWPVILTPIVERLAVELHATICFNNLGLTLLRFEHPNFRRKAN